MGVVLTQVNQPGCPLAGPGARRCFRLLPVKDFHIWLSVGAWAFLVATSALWVSAAKKYTVLHLSYKVKIKCV